MSNTHNKGAQISNQCLLETVFLFVFFFSVQLVTGYAVEYRIRTKTQHTTRKQIQNPGTFPENVATQSLARTHEFVPHVQVSRRLNMKLEALTPC